MADERAAAVAFLRSFATQTATLVEELPYGAGLFSPALPNVWDFNVVWVDALPPTLSAARLAADAERLHSRAGVWHRQIIAADPSSAEALRAGLATEGYGHRRHVIMVQRRKPDRAPPQHAVAELDADDVSRFTEQQLRQGDGLSGQAIGELAESKHVLARSGARFFGVRERQRVVSACELYVGDGVAQIESVVTDAAHRNRGLARAIVLRAADEGRRAGAALVFLQAEEDDWPKHLYTRLGFDTVGAIGLFLRTPPAAPRRRRVTASGRWARA
jgi:ribosomal protein S18 acetylase RimI-like enzyme